MSSRVPHHHRPHSSHVSYDLLIVIISALAIAFLLFVGLAPPTLGG
jgi:hypothetical protein